jgi:hypothetical protein
MTFDGNLFARELAVELKRMIAPINDELRLAMPGRDRVVVGCVISSSDSNCAIRALSRSRRPPRPCDSRRQCNRL